MAGIELEAFGDPVLDSMIMLYRRDVTRSLSNYGYGVGLGLGLLLLGPGPSAAAAGPAGPVTTDESGDESVEDHADAWVGRYRFVGGHAELEARDAAIEEVVAELNVLIRGMARDRLTKANPIPKTLKVSREGDELSVSHDGRERTVNLDGKAVTTKNLFGNPIEYRVEVDQRRLREFIVGEGGRQANTWRRKGSGRIVVKVQVSSPRLPKSLVYSLTFAKQ